MANLLNLLKFLACCFGSLAIPILAASVFIESGFVNNKDLFMNISFYISIVMLGITIYWFAKPNIEYRQNLGRMARENLEMQNKLLKKRLQREE